MSQYQVPQFIETEDKIVGPLTLKQFLYLAIAALISFVLFFILKLFFWLSITILLGIMAAALAFIKYNGQPLPKIIVNALQYIFKPKMYLWKQSQGNGGSAESGLPQIAEIEAISPLKKIWLKMTSVIHPTAQRDHEKKLENYRKTAASQQTVRRIKYQ